MEHHEVRWLPTESDEMFTSKNANVRTGGTLAFVLAGIDFVAESTTVARAAGYMTITVVWEWIPVMNGINVIPTAPNPYTSQQILGTIGDMGRYIYDGIRTHSGNGRAVASMMGVVGAYVKGVQEIRTRAPGMIMR